MSLHSNMVKNPDSLACLMRFICDAVGPNFLEHPACAFSSSPATKITTPINSLLKTFVHLENQIYAAKVLILCQQKQNFQLHVPY